MRSAASIVLMLGLVTSLFSCKKKIHCETQIIKRVYFRSSLSSMKVTDTVAMVRMFNKVSGFTQLSEIFLPIKLTKEGLSDKSMDIPYKGEKTYDYNWEITLLPSNRVYYFSKIEHQNATSKTHYCTNGTSYVIKAGPGGHPLADSSVSIPGNPYSTTPLFIPDFEVQYY